ncbi:MAG: hypothetical protein H0V70_17320 [Ktedonobacteraceae bacterium]|nr:hypothetical protein [Ktedonobacteraceae bacterium]
MKNTTDAHSISKSNTTATDIHIAESIMRIRIFDFQRVILIPSYSLNASHLPYSTIYDVRK